MEYLILGPRCVQTRRSLKHVWSVPTFCNGFCRSCFTASGGKPKTEYKKCVCCGPTKGRTVQWTHPSSRERYCWTCARELFADLVPSRAGEKSSARGPKASRADASDVRGGTKSRRTELTPSSIPHHDPDATREQSGKRKTSFRERAAFCRKRSRQEGPAPLSGARRNSCYYCFSTAQDVSMRLCTYTAHEMDSQVLVCDACAAEKGAVVCAFCWLREWQDKCFRCKMRKAQIQRPQGRFCYKCHADSLFSSTEQSRSCYFCIVAGDNVELRACSYSADCGRRVAVCSNCAALKGAVVCDICWRQAWSGKCFNCKRQVAQDNRSYGRFCKTCYAVSYTHLTLPTKA